MPAFCDVALPVPLEQVFTYSIPHGWDLQLGSRVLAPFRNQQLAGIVVRLFDEPPAIEVKPLARVLEQAPLLPAELMELAQWIATYYVAPIGEVLRGMMPLQAEVRRENFFAITETGMSALQLGAERGSSLRSKLSPEQQRQQYAVLDALSHGEPLSARKLAAIAGARRPVLDAMLRKKWITREQRAEPANAARTERVVVLQPEARLPRLNEKQQAILAHLAGTADGRMTMAALREHKLSESSLQTLARHGAVTIEDQPAKFHISGLAAQDQLGAELTASQTRALTAIVRAIAAEKFSATLLFGVTGSGKTAVYLAAMRHAMERGLSALLLVPEIGLTPAMAANLHAAFGDSVALLHSSLTPQERSEQWRRIQQGDARIVVGTRSAIFAPVQRLGLIIVDEEHDASYKQEENPRYHARDVAVMRAKLADIPVLLGSATPSLESWVNAERGKYHLLAMAERVANRPLPEVERVDMRLEFQETGQDQIFSRRLLGEIQQTLDRGEQAIVLLNRRGYSFVVLCRACGERMECVNCAIALTYHKASDPQLEQAAGHRLECHYCGYRRTVPKLCPKCNSEHLYFFGSGSQQGEEKLRELFPGARIGRMDRDTVRGRHAMERLLARLHAGEINLLVGTQMIAKGHDIHGVTLVGIVNADHALSMPDFRAAERVFQLLTQVSGRAGRGNLPGRVVVQTYYPEHYAIALAAQHDFKQFAEKELHFRRHLFYPPFASLANVIVRGADLAKVSRWTNMLAAFMNEQRDHRALGGVRVLGPAAAPIARIKGIHRFHFILRAQRRDALAVVLRAMLAHAAEKEIPRQNIVVDVDALSLM